MSEFMQKKAKGAFTLAEVLITLAVVGIVAASTIPAVVTKLTRQEYVTKLQKAHNTLVNVIKAAEKEHGPMEHWPAGDTRMVVNTYFKPYLDIMADCESGTNSDNICFAAQSSSGSEYKWLNGSAANALGLSPSDYLISYYKLTTPDGISYAFHMYYATNATGGTVPQYLQPIIVDINGKKSPNQFGRDVFVFNIRRADDEKTRIVPRGYSIEVATRDGTGSGGCNTSATPQAGALCAAKVLTEGAMNY
ncbi:pilin-like protein [Candidatus Gastranaerophilus sp. (ex Termes propinquus)]|nr:pilin-like protein [Candidatus Gastranaerophilus sp. (ex Termes propinquus)]